MVSERESLYKKLTAVDVDVAGSLLRAYYDADGKLVFVLDFFKNEIKPNVLLVLNAVGGRKWDDILANDYGVDLETVRPKGDNKYQKLDVEYSGLAEYDGVLQAYNSGAGFDDALLKLNVFRRSAAMRAAMERRDDAELTVIKARDTIDKTQEKLQDLQGKLIKLRSKLGGYRANVGKEPTKQSAAKILRVEAQIDSTNEKINRAKNRLNKAQKRLALAQDEIDAANNILELLNSGDLPAKPVVTDMTVVSNAQLPAEIDNDFIDEEISEDIEDFEPKAEIMADDDVKPLLDKDPNVLDEHIAFKPVDFSGGQSVDNMPVVQPNFMPASFEESTDYEESEPMASDVLDVSKPLYINDSDVDVNGDDEFTLPAPTENVAEEMPETEEKIDSELLGAFKPVEIPQIVDEMDSPVVPYGEPAEKVTEIYEEPLQAPVYEPIMPQPVVTEDIQNTDFDVDNNVDFEKPEVAMAPISSDYRPVSPMASNTDNDSAAPIDVVSANSVGTRKPTFVYYVMLILLIVLSIFTLWFYQKLAGDSTPVLGAQTDVVETDIDDVVVPEENNPAVFVAPKDVEPQVVGLAAESAQIVEVSPTENLGADAGAADVVFDETVLPEDVPVVQPEPVVFTPEVEPVVVEITQKVEEPVVTEPESPFLSDEEVKLIKTEEEILKEKPAYGVASESEVLKIVDEPDVVMPTVVAQDTVVVDEALEETADSVDGTYVAPVVEQQEVVYQAPVSQYDMSVNQQITSEEYVDDSVDYDVLPQVLNTGSGFNDAPLQQTASEMIMETEVVETCADGLPPDVNGCCDGEESVFVDGEYMCCVIGGDECFPPM